jgi:condensin complex subunit 1
MAPHFIFPRNLQDLEQDSSEDNNLTVQNSINISSFSSSQLEEFVKGLSFDLSDREILCIQDQDIFDRVYSLVRGYSSLPHSSKLNLVESLRSNLAVLLPNVDSLSRVSNGGDDDEHVIVIDRVASHRNAFKIYSYFLLNIVLAEDSSNNAPKVCT